MNENLIGYLLKALDDDGQLAVERHLHTDPDAMRNLELLRRALAPLNADATPPEPSPGLRFRTLALLAEHACRKPVAMEPAPPPPRTIPMPRRWWRRADALVAAAVILVTLSLVPSGIVKATHYRDRLYCKENLRQLGTSLVRYADSHEGYLPKVDAAPPCNFAGVYLPILHGAGVVAEQPPVQCAVHKKKPVPQRRTLDEIRQLTPDEIERYLQEGHDLYAYTLGYHDPLDPQRRTLNGLRTGFDSELIPIAADTPPFVQPAMGVRLPGNSRSHDGVGQNVLRLGGSVDFNTNRHVGGTDKDDIYLNDNGHVAAGLHPQDSVLGASAARPVPVQQISD